MRRYLFGNVIQSVPVIGTLNAADAIGTLAGLGFLGLGIQSDRGGGVGLRPATARSTTPARASGGRRCIPGWPSCSW